MKKLLPATFALLLITSTNLLATDYLDLKNVFTNH